jgi:CelD/BcsL family acetyltransferase involved in cellulose biosynthesis
MVAPFRIDQPQALRGVTSGAAIGRTGASARRALPLLRPLRQSPADDRFALRLLTTDQIGEALADGPFASAWRELCEEALEPNGFIEAGFALAAARHFPVRARPVFLAMWSAGEDEMQRLAALFPLAPAGPGGALTRLWLDKQAALGAPLLRRDCAVAAAERFLEWLAEDGRACGAVFPRIVRDGATHIAIVEAARRGGRSVRTLESFERAALLPGSDPDELWLRGASRKALKELKRRQRRLAEFGEIGFSLSSTRPQVRAATEQFLALEASGWKKARGAFLSDASLLTFVRSATRLLAEEGKCRIASLTLDGAPIAMAILIESGRRAYFWKIAFDERFRAQAPGIHLVSELTREMAARTDIELTDSCAIANHPMIDRFWPDRLPIVDIAVQAGPASAKAFHGACDREIRRRDLRSRVKRIVKKLLGRKES